mmetsp:Transcript_75515/g.230996  ORF Transcript_75515/g.230996 Transcript_75515/m.230996 type:complete len:244 (-) Transcript_75515:508-1239(-)
MLPKASSNFFRSSVMMASVSGSRAAKKRKPLFFLSSSFHRPWISPKKPRRLNATMNSPIVRRPLPSESRPSRQAFIKDPKRIVSAFCRPSTVWMPTLHGVTRWSSSKCSWRSRCSSCRRNARAPPSTPPSWTVMSCGVPCSANCVSSIKSLFAFIVRPLWSPLRKRFHASGSNSASVKPRPFGPLTSILNSFFGSSSVRPRSANDAVISFSSMRPVLFKSMPFCQAVNMSPCFFMSANLYVPT